MKKYVLRNRIKAARAELNLTQSDLARLAGVSKTTICNLESNKVGLTTRLALKICIALKKSFNELFYIEMENKK